MFVSETYSLEDCLLYDDCSTDKTSKFTTVLCEGGTNSSIAFDTDHYSLSGGSKTTAQAILDLALPSKCEISCECVPTSTSFSGAIGLCITKGTGYAWGFIGYSNGSSRTVEYSNSSWVNASSTYNTSTITSGVISLKIIKDSSTFTFKGNNSNDITKTISYDNYYTGFMKGTGTLNAKKIKIKAL